MWCGDTELDGVSVTSDSFEGCSIFKHRSTIVTMKTPFAASGMVHPLAKAPALIEPTHVYSFPTSKSPTPNTGTETEWDVTPNILMKPRTGSTQI